MAMVPHERSLVKRLEGKPFALLGVNFDASKEDQKKSEEKNKITWRSWFDGRNGPLGKEWKIQYLPTIYVLDANGIIRYKGVQDKEMDKAVDALLKEMESKKSSP
jgi:hypothetical protein